jgi:hypothetical protein
MEYLKYLVLIIIGMCVYHIRQYIRELEVENKLLHIAVRAYSEVENEHP